jgi:hypothetical protein
MTLRGSARPVATSNIDLRSAEGRLMARTRHALTQHVGTPSATQKALIERAVMLTVHLARLDGEALRKPLTGDTLIGYLSAHGHLARALERLGTKAVEPEPPSLASYLASRASEDA